MAARFEVLDGIEDEMMYLEHANHCGNNRIGVIVERAYIVNRESSCSPTASKNDLEYCDSDVRFELTTSVPQERRSRGALWDGARRRGERANAAREWRESARASGAGREERALDFSGVPSLETRGTFEATFSVIQSVSKPEQASLVYRSSTRVCVRNCISIRRPEFECSGPQLEGPEFECSGPQLEGPEFEYSELSLKVCGSRYCELDSSNKSLLRIQPEFAGFVAKNSNSMKWKKKLFIRAKSDNTVILLGSVVAYRRKQTRGCGPPNSCQSDPVEEKRDNYFNERREASRTLRNKKRGYLKEKLNEVETNSKNKNIRDLYKGIKEFKNGYQPRVNVIKDENGDLLADSPSILNRWKNYFAQLLNVHRPNRNDRDGIEIKTAEPFIPEPTLSEVEIAIENLKSTSLQSAVQNLKVRIYKTVILPVLLYGCETWTLTLREEHRLRVFENKVLRKIFGAKRDEVTGEWRKLHNTELHALYSSPDIIRNLKSRRLRWAGHVARMGESRNAYRVLVGRPEGKRPLGRPRRRWEDNIKMDLREVGYDDRDWLNLAQDRDRWRAYVRAAMNLRVP
ncbi:hypothetical protein ANN_18411 [Periplaneta americana]|uniref:Uncharacterized protein n=1 Tax=Periplaneta americana TaxID=6978 RepID=A0ABQ8SNN9_PERAM|nr:hypothetical protein ANN_18411 [Periplaneta americana]